MAKLAVVGVGPGSGEYLTPAAENAIREAQVLIGGERNLFLFNLSDKEIFIIKNNLPVMVEYIKNCLAQDKKIAVLATGDPGLFGILGYLRNYFSLKELEVIPGISVAQLACARLAMPWHDAVIISCHGRGFDEVVKALHSSPKVILFTDPRLPLTALADTLCAAGFAERKVYVCFDLSSPSERIECFTLQELRKDGNICGNLVMVIVDE